MMQGLKFYQFENVKATPIYMVTKAQWPELVSGLDKFYQQQCAWQTFVANPGECLMLIDAHGLLHSVYLGMQEGQYFSALASAASKLAPGTYQVQQELSHSDLLGWGMAQYKFLRYKNLEISTKVLLVSKTQYHEIVPQIDAIFHVRDLINTPAEDMGPKALSDVIASLAQLYQGKFSAIVGEELLNQNFPAIYAVGRAGVEAPRLLKLTWGQASHPLVVLIGKGVCFDSGGLDIKPASGMRLMKKDMGGAAQVIGLAQMIMQAQLPIRLMVLCPAVENSIDAKAYRPGDVVRMRNGMHVEIDNTDAEGRVILADALVYAGEHEPALTIDIATLTGAARVAVGTEISALFTNQDEVAQELVKYGRIHNDAIWQLPLYQPYNAMLDSNIADMTNSTASSYAGAITAALFLQRFVIPQMLWLHFDLMAWNVSNKPGRPEGGEAMSILALFAYLKGRFLRG